MSTVLLPITFIALPSISRLTTETPEFWISSALARSITSPSATSTSPVSSETIFSAATKPEIRFGNASFLLNLKRPNLARSYLFGSKNKLLSNVLALSTVGGSPGLNLL